MRPAYVFIDAGYVRRGLEDIEASWQDLDLGALAAITLRWVGDRWLGDSFGVSRTFVYDAVPEEAESSTRIVDQWLERNGGQIDVHVRYGRLAGDRASRRRQVGVDAQLAVDALNFAWIGAYEIAVLVTGDGDFSPVAEAIRQRGRLVGVCAFRNSLSDELRQQADRVGYLPDDPNAWSAWKLPTL